MKPVFTYTLKVTVTLRRPKIWRRIAVPSDIKLPRLHAVIRVALGAPGSAQHFFVDKTKTVYAHPAWDDLPKIQPAKMVALARLLKNPGDTVSYFSGEEEEWEHSVELIHKIAAASVPRCAVCVAGSRIGPMSPKHRGRFSLSAINRLLRKMPV